ncbi:MAG: hypothetical protein ACNA8W_11325, partial [Bradymonadaceae bacterium]
MLEFETEWLDAPAVRDPVLQRTWCRLKISAANQVVTRFNSSISDSVRDGIYISAFPLAKWIVRNWWALLNEGPRTKALSSGTRSSFGEYPHLKDWLGRHSLLFGRDGMHCPDLRIFRDDARIHLQWFVDSPMGASAFISAGDIDADPTSIEESLMKFVDAVADRLQSAGIITDEVADFLANWQAILKAPTDEKILATILGGLGLDPYDESSYEESLLDVCQRLAASASEPLSHIKLDLLAATGPEYLDEDLSAMERFLLEAKKLGADGKSKLPISWPSRLPHEYGYRLADRLRHELKFGSGPIEDIREILERLFGPVNFGSASRSKNILAFTFDTDVRG